MGQIILDNLDCNGDENSLFECSSNGVFVSDCVHYEDVGVRCNLSKYHFVFSHIRMCGTTYTRFSCRLILVWHLDLYCVSLY